MDEKTYKRITNLIKLTVLFLLSVAVYFLVMGLRTPEELLLYVVYIIVGGLVLYFFSWAIYKLLLEKYHYKLKHKWTSEFLSSEHIPSEIAVIGDRRGGKDTLATFIVRKNADAFYNEIERELKKLKNNILYIFDFRKIDRFLDSKHVRKEFMNVPQKTKRQKFKRVFYDNRCFLKGRYMDQYCGSSRKLAIKFIKNKKSGLYFDNKVKKICFFDLLMDYIEGYIRIYVIEQMVISNQPFMELVQHLDGVDLAAKKISYDYFKIKLYKLFPWIRNLIIFDTEATLYWNNSDGQSDIANKKDNGVLEFFIGKGHFLKKFKYVTTIQDAERSQAWYRGLFELKIYLLDKFKFKSTSPVRRFFKRFTRGFYKLMNFLIFKRTQGKRMTSFLMRVSKEHPRRFNRIAAKIPLYTLVYPIYFTERRIKKLTQRESVLLMESMLEFEVHMEFRHKGDAFTTRGIRSLNKKGFNGHNIKTKLVINILDVWPYFSTEHLGDAGDALMERSKIKFKEIPEWDKNLFFDLYKDGKHLKHKLYADIIDGYKPNTRKKKK
jgi:hypothetical protein